MLIADSDQSSASSLGKQAFRLAPHFYLFVFTQVIEKITALLKKFSKQHKTKIPETNVRDHEKHQKQRIRAKLFYVIGQSNISIRRESVSGKAHRRSEEGAYFVCNWRAEPEQHSMRTIIEELIREFDPGSGRTLAVCLTHASRARIVYWRLRLEIDEESGERVSNAWATWP